MDISQISIKNFRGIENEEFDLKSLSIIIGDNGASKTTILEAIHYCLSPYFISNKIKYTDFYNGTNEPIEIILKFNIPFNINIPYLFSSVSVPCDGIFLKIKKRDSLKGISKAFTDGFVVEHYPMPTVSKSSDNKGWQTKTEDGKTFKFGLLQLKDAMKNIPIKSFYFNKERDKQISKGFNSSITSVYDDFNWRFVKNTMNNQENTFMEEKRKLEQTIIDSVDENALDKTFLALNEKLKNILGYEVGLSFIDNHTPFDNAYISKVKGSLSLPISLMGSGIEMLVSLMFLETLAQLSKENIIILIDEPELHLHPTLQNDLCSYLEYISETNQVVVSTHSPFFFKNCCEDDNIKLIARTEQREVIGLFPWSPSWGEINYFAYELSTVEFFNELYGYIQEKTENYDMKAIENYFTNLGIPSDKKWIRIRDGVKQSPESITIISYIRNSIHHSENKENEAYSDEDLTKSIDIMINILMKIK